MPCAVINSIQRITMYLSPSPVPPLTQPPTRGSAPSTRECSRDLLASIPLPPPDRIPISPVTIMSPGQW